MRIVRQQLPWKGRASGLLKAADEALDRNDNDAAVAAAEKAIALDPLEDQFHFLLATALRQQGRISEAYRKLSVNARLQPEQPAIHGLASAVAMELGNLSLAEWHAQRGLEINPQHSTCLNNPGEALKLQGRRAEAVEVYRKACEVDPDAESRRHALVMCLAWLGRYAEAEAEAKLLVERCGETAEHKQLLAGLAEQIAHYQNGKTAAEQRLAIPPATAPRDDAATLRWGDDLLLAGRDREFDKLLQEVSEQAGVNTQRPLLSAIVQFRRRRSVGDLVNAARLFEQARSITDQNPAILGHVGTLAALTYFQLLDYENGLAWATRVAQVEPANVIVIGLIPQMLGLKGEKQVDIDRAVKKLTFGILKRYGAMAIAIAAVPQILLTLLPFPWWLNAILAAAFGLGCIPLAAPWLRSRVPKPLLNGFGDWVSGISCGLVVIAALIFTSGFFSRIIAAAWHGFFAICLGANLDES